MVYSLPKIKTVLTMVFLYGIRLVEQNEPNRTFGVNVMAYKGTLAATIVDYISAVNEHHDIARADNWLASTGWSKEIQNAIRDSVAIVICSPFRTTPFAEIRF